MNNNVLNKKDLVFTILFILLIGFFLFSFNSINGPGYWPDSISYISTSDHLLSGRGFVQYDGSPFVAWAPLFPVLLALIRKIAVFDYKLITNILNIASFIVAIYISNILASRLIDKRLLVWLFTIFVSLSFPLINVCQWAGTESLSILLLVLFFYSLYWYFTTIKNYALIIMAIIVMLCNLLRYPSIILSLAGFLIILLGNGMDNWRRYLKEAVLFVLISCSPIIVWCLRNYLLTDTLFGLRGSSRYSLFTNIKLTLFGIYKLYYPAFPIKSLISVMIVVLLVLLIAIILYYIIAQKHTYLTKAKSFFYQEPIKTKLIVALFTYIIFYLLFLIIVSSIKAHDSIGSRFLVPIFIPLTIIGFYIYDQFIKHSARFVILNTVIIFLFGSSVISNFSASFKSLQKQVISGLGYNSILYSNSEMVNFLRERFFAVNDYKIRMLSNDPHLTYYATKFETQWAPLKRLFNSADPINALPAIKDSLLRDGTFYLVWFYNKEKGRSDWIFSLNELSSEFNFDTLYTFSDGVILKLKE